MTYYVWKLSGLPGNQVIGSGTNLDSARLCYEISRLYDLDSKSVQAYVCGEHGDSEFVLWHNATIGGKKLENVFRDNASRTKNVTKEDLLHMTVEAGWDIFNRKGNTCYGIASSAAAIVKSILFDENHIYPVTTGLNGKYGVERAWLSVPVIIDSTGAKEIVEVELDEEEKAALKKSAAVMESFYDELAM